MAKPPGFFSLKALAQPVSLLCAGRLGARVSRFFSLGLAGLLLGCGASSGSLIWRVRDVATAPASSIDLVAHNRVMATVDKLAMQKLLLAHFRVTRAAEVQAELFVTNGEDPNAFAGVHNGRPMIGVNFGMLKLIGEEIHEFAALVGHEAAHLAKNHGESARNRSNTLNAVGTLFAMGLGAAGVPVGGTIAGLTVDLIDNAYSRDDEREADALGVGYARAAGYDPYGAVRLHEKLGKASGPRLLPFLSSHPGGAERAEAIKALIEAGKSDPTPPRE